MHKLYDVEQGKLCECATSHVFKYAFLYPNLMDNLKTRSKSCTELYIACFCKV